MKRPSLTLILFVTICALAIFNATAARLNEQPSLTHNHKMNMIEAKQYNTPLLTVGNIAPERVKAFWGKVKKTETCWTWIGSSAKDGMPHFNYEGKTQLAQRIAFLLVIGDIPSATPFLHHRCKTAGCVNPYHYELSQTRCHPNRELLSQVHTVAPRICSIALTDEQRSRFWSNVNKDGECWNWTGRSKNRGYGLFNVNGESLRAHRVSYMINVGDIEEGLHVLHQCDNESCVRPEHLFLGTASDNAKDKVAKGRANLPVGEDNHNAVLTAMAVAEIRARYAIGNISTAKLGKEFGVSDVTIGNIVNHKTWKSVA